MPFGLSLSTFKLIGIGILLLAIAGLGVALKLKSDQVDVLKAQVAAVTAQKDQAIAAANSNAAELKAATTDRDAFKAVASSASDQLSATRKAAYSQIAKLKKEIADATAQNECPVAPSVVAVLRGLSGADVAPDSNGNQDGKAAIPGQPDGTSPGKAGGA